MTRAITIEEYPTDLGPEYMVRYDDGSVRIFKDYPQDEELTL